MSSDSSDPDPDTDSVPPKSPHCSGKTPKTSTQSSHNLNSLKPAVTATKPTTPSTSSTTTAVRRLALVTSQLAGIDIDIDADPGAIFWNTHSNFARRTATAQSSPASFNTTTTTNTLSLSPSPSTSPSTSASSTMKFPGGCYCAKIRYEVTLDDPDKDARTSLCHCGNCKKFTGGPFGITTKIPKSAWSVTKGKELVTVHEADNGSGTLLHREFCSECGSGLLEYGANAGDFIYIFYGTLDKPTDLPPKGEFFCSRRDAWMPEVPGIFHKQKVHE